MAKRTHIETVQCERVIYACDLCGQELAPGQSPEVCRVCGRDVCQRNTVCYRLGLFPGDRQGKIICRLCTHIARSFLQEIDTAFVHYGTVEEKQLRLWKALSLQQKVDHGVTGAEEEKQF